MFFRIFLKLFFGNDETAMFPTGFIKLVRRPMEGKPLTVLRLKVGPVDSARFGFGVEVSAKDGLDQHYADSRRGLAKLQVREPEESSSVLDVILEIFRLLDR